MALESLTCFKDLESRGGGGGMEVSLENTIAVNAPFAQSPMSMDGLHRCTLIPGPGCPGLGPSCGVEEAEEGCTHRETAAAFSCSLSDCVLPSGSWFV